MIGGLESMWFAYLLIIVVALCLNGLLASMASDIA